MDTAHRGERIGKGVDPAHYPEPEEGVLFREVCVRTEYGGRSVQVDS